MFNIPTILTRQVLTEKSPYKLVLYFGAEDEEADNDGDNNFPYQFKVIADNKALDCYIIVEGEYKGHTITKDVCKILKKHV
jgi:hypothetical protein